MSLVALPLANRAAGEVVINPEDVRGIWPAGEAVSAEGITAQSIVITRVCGNVYQASVVGHWRDVATLLGLEVREVPS